ncbi:DUF6083 domain-containing protein [Streptomyces sp. NPDC032472]|uniref:DUF6083 domain-containing protein n=1 Tax=Streptomyces sp. NPDC032472 TaxID=3155018 RepID=UPI0033E6453A
MTTSPWDNGGSRLSQAFRLNPHSPSKALRRDNAGRCLYCYNKVWWFDRADGGRIPLIPKQFPTSRVPPRARWSVDAGLARPGAVSDTCWIAHPTVCPGIERGEEMQDAGLADLHRQSAINMQTAIREGRFSAPLAGPEDEGDQDKDVRPAAWRRDVVAYHSVFLLVPSTVEELSCVALSDATNGRCENVVLDPRAGYQGEWAELEIPFTRGRRRDHGLWEGHTMWVWSLNSVSYQESIRWRHQHCAQHATGGTTPDAHPRECEHFDIFRHSQHVRHQRPGTAAGPAAAAEESRVICAGTGCGNGNVGAVPEREIVPDVGWLCWKCRPKHTARRATHRRWQD